jgi:hypothetical protein
MKKLVNPLPPLRISPENMEPWTILASAYFIEEFSDSYLHCQKYHPELM